MSTSVDDETILDVLRENDDPRMTTTEVAEALPVTRGTTRSRLQRLVDDDRLERTRDGNNVVWWLPDRTEELSTATAADEATDDADMAGEAGEGEEEEATSEAGEGEEEEATTDVLDEADDDDSGAAEIEVTATSDTTEQEAATVEVEAVGGDGSDEEPPVEEPVTDGDAEPDLPDLSDDEEGLRALAVVAVGLVLLLLVRRLLSGDDEA